MKIYSVTDKEFKAYGQVLSGYDFAGVLEQLKALPVPEEGIVYEPAVASLENEPVKVQFQNRGFGGMPVQLGYVGGNNRALNCLEYHKTSEFNIALDDVVLVLGIQSEIENGKYDTGNCKAFLVPAGTGVELFATPLHYAPMNVAEAPYRVICVLPQGTNYGKPDFAQVNCEDAMCAGSNKWLMAHPESNEAKEGRYAGLTGENITFDMLNF